MNIIYKTYLKEKFDSIVERDDFEISKVNFSQMDFLRCKGNVGSQNKLFEAIYALKNHPKIKITRIKNRIKALGDIMINFWYDNKMLAECQLYLQTAKGFS